MLCGLQVREERGTVESFFAPCQVQNEAAVQGLYYRMLDSIS